jgi:uncharacterized protein
MPDFTPGMPCWADLGAPDVEASTRFYCDLFGWTSRVAPEPEAMGYTTFLNNGRAVAAVGPKMGEGMPTAWTSYFATDDVDAATRRAESAGGKVLAPPMDVLGYGRMALFMDPGGATCAVWQAGSMPGAEVMGEPGTLGWFELMTRDVSGAKEFYSTLLGLGTRDVSYEEGTYTLWQVDDVPVAGMMPMEGDMWPAELPAHWMVYFNVEDCDASAARVSELGGTVSVPPTDMPAGRFAVVGDPHGAFFSIIKANPDFRP